MTGHQVSRFLEKYKGSKAVAALTMLSLLAACETVDDTLGLSSSTPTTVTAEQPSGDFPNLAEVPDKPPPVTPEEIRQRTAEGLAADRSQAQYTAPLTAEGTASAPATPPQPGSTSVPITSPAVPNNSTASGAFRSPNSPSASQSTGRRIRPAWAAPDDPAFEEPPPASQTTTDAAGVPTVVDEANQLEADADSNALPRSTAPSSVASAPSTTPAPSRSASQPARRSSFFAPGRSAEVGEAAPEPELVDEILGVPVNQSPPSQTPPPAAASQRVATAQESAGPGAEPSVARQATPAPQPVPAPLPQVDQRPLGQSQAALPRQAEPQQDSLQALVPQQGSYGGGQVELVGIIFFANGSAALDRRDDVVLQEIARLHREYGGIVRVVGHASSRTSVLPPEEHRMVNLNVSFDRAEQVAQVLNRYGVGAESLVVEGVADSQPIYAEFMPTGEAGNRRAEVYLEF